jgi:hypothetical protein
VKHQWTRIEGQKDRDLEAASIRAGTISGDIPLTIISEGKVDNYPHAGMVGFEFPKTTHVGSNNTGR